MPSCGAGKAPVPQIMRDIIVIGASAGGVEALKRLVGGLPADFPASVCVVLHIQPTSVSRLPEILTLAGPLPARHPTHGSPIRQGLIYVAPPNQHLLINDGHLELSAGPNEQRTRPAINPLFRSAALAYGPRVIGVVLTGTLDDGTAGLWEIKQRGGTTVVQEPKDAGHPDMPRNALEQVSIDHVMPLRNIASLLADLVSQPIDVPATKEEAMNTQQWTDLTCPECRGPIRQFNQGTLTEYRCRVGHDYSPESYVAAESETRERTLWAAILALEEAAEVMKGLADQKPKDKHRLQQLAYNNLQASEKIRELREWLTKEESRHVTHEGDGQATEEEP